VGINFGTATPAAYYIGSSTVSAIYLGSSEVFSSTPVITITTQPSNYFVVGTTAEFTVAASVTGVGSITYQWQKQTNGYGSFANVSGATSSTLSLTGLYQATNENDTYRCVLSSTGAASVTSSSAYVYWPGVSFTDRNSIWTSIGFSGSGSYASPYTKTNYSSNVAGMQAKVIANFSGPHTVRITGQAYSDFGIDFYKNGTLLGQPPSIGDANNGNGGTYSLNVSISVDNNDIIRIGSPANGDYIDFTSSTFNIWVQ
jgi:hypothetical protein